MTRFLFALVAVACIGVTSCGQEQSQMTSTVEAQPLKGSALIVSEHLTPVPSEEPWFTESPAFKRYFHRVGRLEFDDDALFNQIGTLDVSAEGRFLVADRNGKEAYLFEPDGRLLKVLSPETCHPGLDWWPFSAVFYPDGSIFVNNSAPQPAHRFDSDGECIGSVSHGQRMIKIVAGSIDGTVYGFRSDRDEYYIDHLDSTGTAIKRVWSGTEFKNGIGRYLSGGLVRGFDGRLFLALPPFRVVFTIDPETGVAEELGSPPEYYRPVGPDLPDVTSGMDELMSAMKEFMGSASITSNVLFLDDEKLLVLYSNQYEDFDVSEKGLGLHVISTKGELLVQEPILMMGYLSHFAAARDGLLYRVTYPVEQSDGSWSNYGLMVYRFIGDHDSQS